MIEIIPYIGGAVTIVFGFGFYFGLQELKSQVDEIEENRPFEKGEL